MWWLSCPGFRLFRCPVHLGTSLTPSIPWINRSFHLVKAASEERPRARPDETCCTSFSMARSHKGNFGVEVVVIALISGVMLRFFQGVEIINHPREVVWPVFRDWQVSIFWWVLNLALPFGFPATFAYEGFASAAGFGWTVGRWVVVAGIGTPSTFFSKNSCAIACMHAKNSLYVFCKLRWLYRQPYHKWRYPMLRPRWHTKEFSRGNRKRRGVWQCWQS